MRERRSRPGENRSSVAPVIPGPQKTEVVDHIFSKEMMRVFLEDNWSPGDVASQIIASRLCCQEFRPCWTYLCRGSVVDANVFRGAFPACLGSV